VTRAGSLAPRSCFGLRNPHPLAEQQAWVDLLKTGKTVDRLIIAFVLYRGSKR